MRKLLTIALFPVLCFALIMAFSSTGLALAVYILTIAVSALPYASLYLQGDLEDQLLTEIGDLRDNVERIDREALQQKEELVAFRREIITLDAHQDKRISALEEQIPQLIHHQRGGLLHRITPALMVLVFVLIVYGIFSTPSRAKEVSALETQEETAYQPASLKATATTEPEEFSLCPERQGFHCL